MQELSVDYGPIYPRPWLTAKSLVREIARLDDYASIAHLRGAEAHHAEMRERLVEQQTKLCQANADALLAEEEAIIMRSTNKKKSKKKKKKKSDRANIEPLAAAGESVSEDLRQDRSSCITEATPVLVAAPSCAPAHKTLDGRIAAAKKEAGDDHKAEIKKRAELQLSGQQGHGAAECVLPAPHELRAQTQELQREISVMSNNLVLAPAADCGGTDHGRQDAALPNKGRVLDWADNPEASHCTVHRSELLAMEQYIEDLKHGHLTLQQGLDAAKHKNEDLHTQLQLAHCTSQEAQDALRTELDAAKHKNEDLHTQLQLAQRTSQEAQDTQDALRTELERVHSTERDLCADLQAQRIAHEGSVVIPEELGRLTVSELDHLEGTVTKALDQIRLAREKGRLAAHEAECNRLRQQCKKLMDASEARLCQSCCEADANATFVHGDSGHRVFCQQCAVQWQGDCPMCNQPVDRVIREYAE